MIRLWHSWEFTPQVSKLTYERDSFMSVFATTLLHNQAMKPIGVSVNQIKDKENIEQ